MGYRRLMSEENLPPQVQYQWDPTIAQQQKALGEEAYARSQDQERRQDEMNAQTLAINREGMRSLGEGLAEAAEGYKKSRERGQEMALRQQEMERQGRLTEEQLAASKQQRELAAQEEQRRAERSPFEVEALKAQTDTAKAQASKLTKEEEFENAVAAAEDALPGESNRAYKARKQVETEGYNAQTARQALAVQQKQIDAMEQEIALKKDMAPLEKQRALAEIAAAKNNLAVSQRQIKELDRAQAVKDATNVLQAEMSSVGGAPEAKQQRVQAAVAQLKAQGVPTSYIAEAINNANASEAQKAFMAKQIDMMDPEKQFNVQNLLQGRKDYTVFKQATSDLQNALERYKNSSALPDTEGKAALEQAQKALRSAGEDALAEDLAKPVDLSSIPANILARLSGSPEDVKKAQVFGRTYRLENMVKTLQTKWGQRLKALEKDDARFGKMGEEIANMRYTPIQGRNIVNDWLAPQQPMTAGQPQQPASTVELQGMPGVKINYPKAKVGNK